MKSRPQRKLLISFFRLAAMSAALATASVSAQAPSDARLALIIGNSAYASAPLLNPANDAQTMSGVLRKLGFQVTELRDGSKGQDANLSYTGERLKVNDVFEFQVSDILTNVPGEKLC